MSVLIATSLGDIVVDLFTDRCPLTSKNFLKLCKIKYYNGCLFHSVQKDFTAQTGDPTGTGSGGDSVYKFLYGDQARFFTDEIHHDLKHSKMGTVAMASAGENLNASQFYFTLRDDLDYLDEKHTVFGEVAEGLETLSRINEAFVDEKNRPYKNIRIKHTYILEDPFEDPPELAELIPDASPEGKPKDEADDDVRLEDDWVPMDEKLGPAELEEVLRSKEAHSSAVALECIGDIPDAEIRPPDNVLFVCKLNPVTEDEDLHTIFSRFGTVISAEVIRDWKTGDSLCYAFIEFETRESCEQAYFKMDNALIDDRRIHVDFSQSVAKLWSQYRRKDHQMSKGRGCFKCGSLDHIAKDCTGGPPTNLQPSKYILKDDNVQHGGDDNSRYDMVFDEEAPESPRRGKRHQAHDRHDREDQHKMSRHRSSEQSHRDKEKKNTTDWRGQKDKTGGHREDRSQCDGRDQNYLERANCERPREKNEQRNRKISADNDDRERRDYWDQRKRGAYNDDRERKEYGDHRKRSAEFDEREKRDHGGRRKRSADDDERERSHRDQRKRGGHVDRREGRADGYREGSRDDDDYKGRREERAYKYKHRESVDDYGRDRSERSERKR